MTAPARLMIFDLDGTLASTGKDLAASVNYTLSILGMPGKSEDVIAGYVGDGIRQLLVRALGPDGGERLDEALAVFRGHYALHLLDTTILYPGVPEVLRRFPGARKLVVTNKTEAFARQIVEKLGIASFFADVFGADTTPFQKPDPRLLDRILDRHPSPRESILVVGDGVNDILFARNGGVRCCAVLNGLGRREDLLALKPDYVCEHIASLADLFP